MSIGTASSTTKLGKQNMKNFPNAMRISFIIPWITKGRGGTENVGQLMANAMANRGHEVHVYTFDNNKQPSRWPLDSRIKFHFLPEGGSPHVDSQMTVALAEPCPDLIVGLHMNKTMLRYTVAAQKIRVPLVLSEHIDPHFPNRLGVFSTEERYAAFCGASRVHLLTKSFKDALPEYLKAKVDVVPNTVKVANQPCDPVGGKQKKLITVARLVPRKNLHRLIDEFASIAEKHPNWILQILGDGPMMKELKDSIASKGLKQQIELLGHSDEPYSFLEQAQLFVLPSVFEGFPMSSLEAMAHGMPVVGYAACNGINEQIVDGVNGYLVPHSFDFGGLAASLDELMGNDSLRSQMGAASKQHFDALYSNKVVFDAWEAMFKDARSQGPDLLSADQKASTINMLAQLVLS